MGIFEQLVARAEEKFRQMQSHAEALEKKIADAEKAKAQAQLDLQNTRSALKRLDSFVPEKGGNLYCPDCFIMRGLDATLRPIPSDQSRVDLFRCNECNQKIALSV